MAQVEKDIINYFLKSSTYIGGSHPSIADILACCELEQPIMAGYEYTDAIKSYMSSVKTHFGELWNNAHHTLWNLGK